MVLVPAVVEVNETLLYVLPDPVNVWLSKFITIDEVPALTVKPVEVVFQLPLRVTVLEPKFIARVFEPVDVNPVAVTAKLLVVKVPFVTVTTPEDVKALPNVTVPAVASTVTAPSVLPPVVSVPVAVSVNVPEYVTV
jgi:hypothetical protein